MVAVSSTATMATWRCIDEVSKDRKAESRPDSRSMALPLWARRARAPRRNSVGCHPTRPNTRDGSPTSGGGPPPARRSDVGDRVVGQDDAPLAAHPGHVLGEDVAHQEQVAGHVVPGRQLLGVALEVHDLLRHQHKLACGPGAQLLLELELLAEDLTEARLAERHVEHGVEHHLEASGDLLD